MTILDAVGLIARTATDPDLLIDGEICAPHGTGASEAVTGERTFAEIGEKHVLHSHADRSEEVPRKNSVRGPKNQVSAPVAPAINRR